MSQVERKYTIELKLGTKFHGKAWGNGAAVDLSDKLDAIFAKYLNFGDTTQEYSPSEAANLVLRYVRLTVNYGDDNVPFEQPMMTNAYTRIHGAKYVSRLYDHYYPAIKAATILVQEAISDHLSNANLEKLTRQLMRQHAQFILGDLALEACEQLKTMVQAGDAFVHSSVGFSSANVTIASKPACASRVLGYLNTMLPDTNGRFANESGDVRVKYDGGDLKVMRLPVVVGTVEDKMFLKLEEVSKPIPNYGFWATIFALFSRQTAQPTPIAAQTLSATTEHALDSRQ